MKEGGDGCWNSGGACRARGQRSEAGGGGAPRHQEALGGVKVEGLHLAGVPPQHGLRAGHVGRHRGPRAS